MITNIQLEKLQGHPKNPRLIVGDVTELADSIKERGILQNLTVVPDDNGMYTVIIGHRRLEASKLAGLKEVPCVITEMDDKTQVATMLVENMQRSDLTPYEQAQGIQQCLDLGMSDKDILKKTGFSKSTLRNRKQMLKLDTEKVQSAQNVSIDDFINLERIDDIEKRNELLKHAGTDNFNMEVEEAYQDQEQEKRDNKVLEVLNEVELYMIEDNDYNIHRHDRTLSTDDEEELTELLEYLRTGLDSEKTYVYQKNNWRFYLYYLVSKSNTSSNEEAEEAERERNREVRRTRKELKPLFVSAYNLRYEFMKELVKGKITEPMVKHLTKTLTENMLNVGRTFVPDKDKLEALLNYELYDKEDRGYFISKTLNKRATREIGNARANNIMIASVYLSIDKEDINCYGHQGEYSKYNAEFLQYVYDFIIGLGYKPSDLEKQLLDGTYPSYDNNKNKEESESGENHSHIEELVNEEKL
ncbi:ParB/RepB/Spo0J family partition protein [Erysipelothrix aquatica]|uniref:ParB/RepB/Spo0J family partition protein n=1 Tax=Erysipelothrix aquatica TaxID=2683714 RepID=UPI00135CF067|nr:ParB/RepB/Spo0J family partition protein [Erysipelothrix aquatica]